MQKKTHEKIKVKRKKEKRRKKDTIIRESVSHPFLINNIN